MSKIEEALRKARSSSPAPGTATEPGRTLALKGHGDIDAHIDRTREIQQMREPSRKSPGELVAARIIFPGMDDHRVTNAFRELRTKILKRTAGRNCVVVVTGTARRAGCSFVALNLAVAFSFEEAKTALLVDCNLGDPSHNSLLPPGDHLGLVDYLETEGVSIDRIIHPVGIPRLRVIPSGRRRNAGIEHVTLVKMSRLLDELRTRYPDRYIIVDAPPVLDSPDARILADVGDCSVLVVPYGQATESRVFAATRALDTKKMCGVVFNNEPTLPELSFFRRLYLRFGRPANRARADAAPDR